MTHRAIAPAALLGGALRCTLAAQARAPGPAPRLDRIGWMPGKTEAIDRRFRAVTVSLVLAGDGRIAVDGRRMPLRAPALLVLRPGQHAAYGPATAWDELFAVWSGPAAAVLPALGLDDGPALRPLAAPRLATAWAALLLQLAPAATAPGVAEQLDLAALGLVRAAIGADAAPAALAPAARVRAAAAELRRRLGERIDLDGVAARHGFSPSQVRRACRAHLGLPPAAWLAAEREATAERALAAGGTVRAVAAAAGFPDRRAFTRWWSRRTGRPPSRSR
jgi:AraC-like DNA-binding protein